MDHRKRAKQSRVPLVSTVAGRLAVCGMVLALAVWVPSVVGNDTTDGENDAADLMRSAAAPQESTALGLPARADETKDIEVASERGGVSGGFHLPGKDIVQVLGALALVVGLLMSVKAILARNAGGLGGGRPSGVVEVLARYPVARGQQLVLLKLARRVVLLHQNGTSMSTLSEIVDPDEVASVLGRVEAGSGKDPTSFKKLLGRFTGEYEAAGGDSRLPGGGEVIDLTRSPNRGLRSLFSGRGGPR